MMLCATSFNGLDYFKSDGYITDYNSVIRAKGAFDRG
jgi:hypothetical protein